MCNIAGYVGKESAAPILLDMLRREEGFDGGYYSGIATIHEGKIYYTKITGDVRRLIDNTDAASLPGNIGIIHSRSGPISGGDEWAHPFVGNHGHDVKIAYVANGGTGCFADRTEEQNKLAESLLEAGYNFPSRIVFDGNAYRQLSDGTTVHMSDVMCQLILRNMDNGANALSAMTDAFCEMPSEIVGLLLSVSEPDGIFWSRINQPMFVGFASHGAYLATTAMAFPDDAGEPRLLDSLSSGCVYCDRYETVPYKKPPASVAPIDADVRIKAYNIICEKLKEGGVSYYDPISGFDMPDILKPAFESADCVPASPLAYDILYSLKKRGRLKIEEIRVPTSNAGIEAPHILMGIE